MHGASHGLKTDFRLLAGIIMPPIPEKNVVQKYQASTEFIVQRQQALNVFINRVVRNLDRCVRAACALVASILLPSVALSKTECFEGIHELPVAWVEPRSGLTLPGGAKRFDSPAAVLRASQAPIVVRACRRQRIQSWARAASCRCSSRPESRTGKSSRHALSVTAPSSASSRQVTLRASITA